MASGKPDYHDDSIISGKHAANFVPIGVDANGNMIAIMQGDFGGAPQTIAVDAAGRMLANLSAQDLPAQIISPCYVYANSIESNTNVPSGVLTTIGTVNGQGIVYSACVWCDDVASRKAARVSASFNNHMIPLESFETRLQRGYFNAYDNTMFLVKYDDVNFNYGVCLRPNLIFSTSFHLLIYHTYGLGITFYAAFTYAIVP